MAMAIKGKNPDEGANKTITSTTIEGTPDREGLDVNVLNDIEVSNDIIDADPSTITVTTTAADMEITGNKASLRNNVLSDGTVNIYKGDPEGEPAGALVATLEPGDYFPRPGYRVDMTGYHAVTDTLTATLEVLDEVSV
jgi:hypothetical protein